MPQRIDIRAYDDADAEQVCALFVAVNRLLAPAHLRCAFENYISRSLEEEIGRISDYYAERDGSFWVAVSDAAIVGMFGLEQHDIGAQELRRMYVAPDARKCGIARQMLAFAEDYCRARGVRELHLSTSELQPAALSLYRNAGYRLIREEVADTKSNKTIGGGVRRYHFVKDL